VWGLFRLVPKENTVIFAGDNPLSVLSSIEWVKGRQGWIELALCQEWDGLAIKGMHFHAEV
jgi:hypothetical protein